MLQQRLGMAGAAGGGGARRAAATPRCLLPRARAAAPAPTCVARPGPAAAQRPSSSGRPAVIGDGGGSGGAGSGADGGGGAAPPQLAPPLAPPPVLPASNGKPRRVPQAAGDSAGGGAPAAATPSLSEGLAPPSPGEAPWYGVLALAALAALICAIDRAAISVAILPMSEQYGWSDTVKGGINAAFYAGYTLLNLFGGYLAATQGAKRTLGAGVVVWSFFTLLTPAAAASRSMPALLATRFLMGAGEGTAYPCVQSVVKGWVPADARSRALTLVYSGGQLGTILALLTAPLIIQHLGWPAVFWVYGSLGLLWMAAWQPLVGDVPPLYRQLPPLPSSTGAALAGAAVSVSAKAGADAGPPAPMPPLSQLPWRRFFSNRAFWGIICAHSTFGSGHYIMLSWLPTFYYQAFNLDVQQSATLSVLPWLATVLVSSSSGWVADHLANEGHLSMTATRKAMQTAGGVLPALCLLALAQAQSSNTMDLTTALLLLVGAVALHGFQSAGFASNHQDIAGPRYAPVLFGFTNALSSLVGSASVYATGALLDAGYSWGAVFQLVAALWVLGAAGYLVLGSGERQPGFD